MILKLLLVIGVITAVYFIFFKKKNTKSDRSNSKIKDVNDMVQCENCGVYCELQDSMLSNGKYYCSQECMEEDVK